MTDPNNFSLFILLLLVVISVAVRMMQPIRWGYLMLGQSLVTLAVVVGGTLLKQPLIGQGLGWFLFIIFHIPAWYVFRQSRRAMTSMNTVAMLRYGRLLPYLFWGAPGKFWRDMTEAYVAYASDKKAMGDQILERWQNYPSLPKQLKDVPVQYRLYGQALLWHWQGVVDEFEKLRFGAHKVSPALYFMASRAYIELGQYAKSAECLKQAKFEESINPLDSLALSLLPFFALCGARGPVAKLLNIIGETNKDLPYSLSLYWFGRCLAKEGELAQARESFNQAMDLTDVPLLRKRLETAIAKLDEVVPADEFSIDQCRKEVDDIWKLFTRGAFIQEILSPRRSSILVNGLIAATIIAFLLSNKYFQPFGARFSYDMFTFGALTDDTLTKNQYWRLVTYLFLHGGIIHICVNLLGLQFFGRIAENVFGSVRFLAIYFVGGILSGIAHLLLSPGLIAVGASGAILAIFGAVGAGIYKLKDVLPADLRKRYLYFMLAIALSQVVLDQFDKHIAAFAHLGGLISGFALGMVTSIRTPSVKKVDGTQRFVEG
ncbi:MAG: rhomboid family intramembrane serine protease [Cyanobacteria bacterium SZAS LIN-3]|nr:rhomboid family intramembrane serine protease [Cyanobacteria bacterium SZAS LIN-3]